MDLVKCTIKIGNISQNHCTLSRPPCMRPRENVAWPVKCRGLLLRTRLCDSHQHSTRRRDTRGHVAMVMCHHSIMYREFLYKMHLHVCS